MHPLARLPALDLRRKLLLFAAAISLPLILLAALMLASAWDSGHAAVRNASDQEAELALQALEAWYREQVAHLRIVEDLPGMDLASPLTLSRVEHLGRHMDIWRDLDWVDPRGVVRTQHLAIASFRDGMVAEAPWFHRVATDRRPVLTSLVPAPGTRNGQVLIAFPIIRDHTLRGVLVATYDPGQVAGQLAKLRRRMDPVAVLDPTGRIVASNRGAAFEGAHLTDPRRGTAGSPARLTLAPSRSGGGGGGPLVRDATWPDGSTRPTVLAISPRTGWMVGVGRHPPATFPVWQGVGGLAVLALGTSVGVALWLAARLSRPLHGLAEAARGLADGDFTCRAEAAAGDEVGLVATAFNAMAERIQAQQRALEARVRERSAQLARQQSFTREVLDHIPVIVVYTDAHGELLMANPEAQRRFGLPGEGQGRPVEAYLPGPLAPRVRDWIDRAATSGLPLTMFSEPSDPANPSSTSYWDSRYQPLKSVDGRVEGVLIVAVDVTDQVRMRQRLRDQLDQLQELDRMKTDFISTVHHELRTPLSLITGFGTNLLDGLLGPLAPGQLEAVDRMVEAADRLSGLVNELIDVQDVTSGRMAIVPYPIEMRPLLEAATAAFAGTCADRGLELRLEVPEDLPPTWADPNRVEQILRHLLANAAKFTPPGGVLTVGSRVGGGYVCTEVRDTGIGIPAEALPQLFTRFYQVESTTTRRFGGTGVGLFLVKRLVDAMRGTVHVQSTQGVGTTFTICLPIAGPSAGAAAEAEETNGGPGV